MKKLLALVLALVMVMGLATVGTNAALKEYTDADDINFDEAVAVMTAVGVLEGADNMFRPGVELKRSEAAKIVAYLNTNNKTAEGLIGVGKFSDVPTNHWAAGYIDYLTSINVLAGRGNVFDPDGDLTAVDFAKMLLVVLGFDPQIEGLVGNDYKINTTKLAQDEKLFRGLGNINVNEVITREQAAQMAFNAIKAPTVEYSNKGGSISINGAEIAIGASNYNYVTSTIAEATHIGKGRLTNSDGTNSNTGYTVEFGERQYPSLILEDTYDVYGRPASDWVYNKEEVGLFVNHDLLLETYTTAVTGADLFELLGESRIKNSDLIYKVNGYEVEYLDPNQASYTAKDGTPYKEITVGGTKISAYNNYIANSYEADQAYRSYGMHASNMIRSNKIPYAFTGNGVLTEVYEKGKELIIVSIYTYYAEADSDYSPRSDKLTLSVYSFDAGAGLTANSTVMDGGCPAPTFRASFPNTVSAEDVPAAAGIKEKDKMLVRVAYTDAKKFEVQEIYEPEVVKGASISKFSTTTIGQQKTSAPSIKFGSNTRHLVADGLFYEGYIVTGGDTQNYSKAVYPKGLFEYANSAIDGTFDVVYDLYDYVIATKPNATAKKYVFIAGVDNYTSNLGVRQADAFAIFANGDSATIKVDVFKTNEQIEAYMAARAGKNTTTGEDDHEYNGLKLGDYSPKYPELDIPEPLHAYNRWFSYSVTGEGASAVYTLKPAGNSLMTGQTSMDNDSTVSNTNVGNPIDGSTEVPVINLNSPRVVGDYADYGTPITGSVALARRSAWGNQDSVYITVNTGKVSAKQYTVNGYTGEAYQTANDGSALFKRGISNVTGIYTGIQNVSLKAWPKGADAKESKSKEMNPFRECFYTVFDPTSRYIIASIVVGSDRASSDHYVYAISSADKQWVEGGYDYWTFNAIVDGEETQLTVKEAYGETIKKQIMRAMSFDAPKGDRGGMFEVTLDKDGYVIGAKQVRYDAGLATWDNQDAVDKIFANWEIGNKKIRINNDHVLYETYFANDDLYRAERLTLYNTFDKTGSPYNTNQDIGLTIAAGAPIYVIQQMRLEASGQTVTDIQKFSDFNAALGAVAKDTGDAGGRVDSKRFSGFVSAVVSNGNAKWVVLKNVMTVLNYDNSKGTPSTGGSSGQLVELMTAYDQSNGFKIRLTNFGSGSHRVEIWTRDATGGSDEYRIATGGYITQAIPADGIMYIVSDATVRGDAATDIVIPDVKNAGISGSGVSVKVFVDGVECDFPRTN